MSITERNIPTPQALIRVRESGGSGMPLLMLHGSGFSKDVFRKQLESPLADIWHMIAIDLPGHGESSDAANPGRDYTISGLADTVGRVMDQLGVSRAAVLGWSLGGQIAMELAAARSDLAGLMLCACAPMGRGPLASFRAFHTNRDTLLASRRKYSPQDCERFLRLAFGQMADLEFLPALQRADGRLRATVVRSMMLGMGIDQKSAFEHASIPIALVNGADEPMVRLSYLESLRCPMQWDGRPHTIAGAGHASFWQRPESFNVLLHRFMHDVAIDRRQDVGQPEVARTA